MENQIGHSAENKMETGASRDKKKICLRFKVEALGFHGYRVRSGALALRF